MGFQPIRPIDQAINDIKRQAFRCWASGTLAIAVLAVPAIFGLLPGHMNAVAILLAVCFWVEVRRVLRTHGRNIDRMRSCSEVGNEAQH